MQSRACIDMMEQKAIPPGEMSNLRNKCLHWFYLGLNGFCKYLSFPLCNWLRFGVIRLFSRQILTSYIMDGVAIWFPWRVAIGRRSSLKQGVFIDGFGYVTIGKGVRIAAYTSFNTSAHAYADADRFIVDQGYVVAPIVVEDDVWVGAGVNINKGVTTGRGAIIGSGSVVTKDIPPYCIAVGVPCQVIRTREHGN